VPNERLEADDASTQLTEEELQGLLPRHISSRLELNQWEALNIARAYEHFSRQRPSSVLSVDFLRELHYRMFEETWTWAGKFRQSENNISPYPASNVSVMMYELVQNTQVQFDAANHSPAVLDEIAVRFHHQLVRIHPWPNGNGRHARLATDLLLEEFGRPPFTWGSGANLAERGGPRSAYIEALHLADGGDFTLLREFARS